VSNFYINYKKTYFRSQFSIPPMKLHYSVTNFFYKFNSAFSINIWQMTFLFAVNFLRNFAARILIWVAIGKKWEKCLAFIYCSSCMLLGAIRMTSANRQQPLHCVDRRQRYWIFSNISWNISRKYFGPKCFVKFYNTAHSWGWWVVMMAVQTIRAGILCSFRFSLRSPPLWLYATTSVINIIL